MKPVKKTTAILLALLFVVVMAAGIYLKILTDEYIRSDEQKGKDLDTLKQEWAKAANERLQYRQERAEYIDSLTMLNVQKAQVEIELNRTRAQLEQANATYKTSRKISDTPRALTVCDSIVYTYLPEYFRGVDTLESIAASSTALQTEWEYRADSVINLNFDKIDSTFKSQVEEKQQGRKEKRKEGKRRKGELLQVGFFGAAVGVLLTIIFGG